MTPPETAPDAIPVWLRRTGAISWRLLVVVALAAVTVWLAVVLGTVTASVLVALIVAATFGPLTRSLRARGWSSTKAAAVVTLAAVVVGIAILVIILLTFVPDALEVIGSLQTGIERLKTELAAGSVPPEILQQLQAIADELRNWVGGELGALVSSVATIVTIAFLGLFLTFFVLKDGEQAWAWVLQVTADSKRSRIDKSGRDALERVGGYLRGTAILSAVRAGITAGFLWLFGVPLILPLALLVLVGGFVPYLGGVISIVAVGLVALGAIGVQSTLLLLVIVVATNVVIANVIRPRVFGDSVHLHPAIVLIALTAGAVIAGIGGVIIAVPAAAFVVGIGGALRDALEPETGAAPNQLVAGWLDRLAQWSWRLLAAFGVGAIVAFLISQAPLVVTPVVLAVVIASAIAPLSATLHARGWGPGASALAATAGTFLVIVAAIVIAGVQMAQPIVDAIQGAIAGAGELTDDAGGVIAWVQPLAEIIGGAIRDAAAAVLGLFGALGVILLITALLTFYLLRDSARAWEAALQRVRPWRRVELDAAGRRSVDILGGYMFGTAAISAVGAISQLLIMLLLDLPFAVPIAVLSFIACFIPYYGGFITTGLAFLVALAFGTSTQVVIMFVYTIVFNIVQGNVVTPIVYNRAVNLHPAVVLLAIPAGGALAGIAGMFLAVPILAVIATTWRSILLLMGEKPPVMPQPAVTEEAASAQAPVLEGGAQATVE